MEEREKKNKKPAVKLGTKSPHAGYFMPMLESFAARDDLNEEAHIKTFVTEFSLDLGTAGRAAINNLVGRAAVLQGKRLPADGLFLSEE